MRIRKYLKKIFAHRKVLSNSSSSELLSLYSSTDNFLHALMLIAPGFSSQEKSNVATILTENFPDSKEVISTFIHPSKTVDLFSDAAAKIAEIGHKDIDPNASAENAATIALRAIDLIGADRCKDILFAAASREAGITRYYAAKLIAENGIGTHEEMVTLLLNYPNQIDSERFIFTHRCASFIRSVDERYLQLSRSILHCAAPYCTDRETTVAAYLLPYLIDNPAQGMLRADSSFRGYTAVLRDALIISTVQNPNDVDLTAFSPDAILIFLSFISSIMSTAPRTSPERSRAMKLFTNFNKIFPYSKNRALTVLAESIMQKKQFSPFTALF